MRVLVTYGTKLGGTMGIAELIGEQLSSAGIDATVAPAAEKMPPDDFDAVIVGGALYASHWSRDARRYIRTFTKALRNRPVWLFSSGPLDDSALEGGIPPVSQVTDAMERLGARGHVTFGGRLEPDAKGVLAGAMAKTQAGDWRDREQIAGWADEIAASLNQPAAPG